MWKTAKTLLTTYYAYMLEYRAELFFMGIVRFIAFYSHGNLDKSRSISRTRPRTC